MSMGGWTHQNPVLIHFGRSCRKLLSELLAGRRTLIVCSLRGRQQLESDPLLSQILRVAKSVVWMDQVETNPDIRRLQDQAKVLLDAQVDGVVAFGGGSAIDSAKVISLALSPVARQHSLRGLLDVAARLPAGSSLPLYALPTTAGTGSEVTPYATVWDHAEYRKLSFAGPAVYPHTAFVDPDLSDSVPLNSTLHAGLDAINQAAESIWSRNMTPMTEMLAHRALKLGMEALPRLLNDMGDPNLRDTMAEVSLLAGLAISQTRTSLCHSISYPMTAHFGVPHGLACAFTMPAVLRHNLTADDGRLERLAGVFSGGEAGKTAEMLIQFDALNQELKVAERVRELVGSLEELISLRKQMATPGRSDNIFVKINDKELKSVLTRAWQT